MMETWLTVPQERLKALENKTYSYWERKGKDMVHHPDHYSWRGGMECMDIVAEMTRKSFGIVAYLIGCAIKYIYRYPRKGGLQDMTRQSSV